eukprot:6214208-Pleurochrysis_carterae.AAC.9
MKQQQTSQREAQREAESIDRILLQRPLVRSYILPRLQTHAFGHEVLLSRGALKRECSRRHQPSLYLGTARARLEEEGDGLVEVARVVVEHAELVQHQRLARRHLLRLRGEGGRASGGVGAGSERGRLKRGDEG